MAWARRAASVYLEDPIQTPLQCCNTGLEELPRETGKYFCSTTENWKGYDYRLKSAVSESQDILHRPRFGHN